MSAFERYERADEHECGAARTFAGDGVSPFDPKRSEGNAARTWDAKRRIARDYKVTKAVVQAAIDGDEARLRAASTDSLQRAAHRLHIVGRWDRATYGPAAERIAAVLAERS